MIVDDINDHLDSRAVKRLYHAAKLVNCAKRVRARAVAVMRCEKREGLISPVVTQARRTVLFVKGKDRQKLDGTNVEILQIGDLVD